LRNAVIIVAGGSGKRMGSNTPKQFLPLSGKPVLMYSIELFAKAIPGIRIIVVLPENQLITWQDLCATYDFNINHELIGGGPRRFHSVKQGLSRLRDEQLVAIHDGVRPLVSHDTIQKAFYEAGIYGNAIPCLKVKESIREISGSISKPLDRNKIRSIQTPQVFRCDKILKAYRQQYREEFTDDATVLEHMGESIHLFEGNPENVKLTTPLDLKFAETVLRR